MIRGLLLGCLALGLAMVCIARAEVLRVPAEFSTIQAAFGALDWDDTVLVSLGIYAEELTAPPRRFWLMGDVEIDTGDFPKPVIDPSSLDSAQWRKCLILREGCELTIERVGFVNRAPMYPRGDAFATGGILMNTTQPLTLRYCAFDSVNLALHHTLSPNVPVHVVVEDCRFTNAPRSQIRAGRSGRVEARRCYFHGEQCASYFIYCGDGAEIEECVFTGDVVAGAVVMQGDDLVMRDCLFGPFSRCNAPVVRIESWTRSVVAGNLFHDIGLTTHDCLNIYVGDGQPVLVVGNHFVGIRGRETAATGGIWVSRNQQIPMGITAVIDSNIFEQCRAAPFVSGGKALNPQAPIAATANRFTGLEPDSMPVIEIGSYNFAESVFRHNLFDAGDYGVRSEVNPVDAVLNYWGDSTGPYNARYHPEGRGARVDDLVLFDPWLPDTSLLNSVKPRPPLPKEFALEAYPNPFNNTVMLRLVPSSVKLVQVDLFDVLGRKVHEIWRGPLAEEKKLSFEASALVSGTYFVRVTDTMNRRVLAMTSLVLAK